MDNRNNNKNGKNMKNIKTNQNNKNMKSNNNTKINNINNLKKEKISYLFLDIIKLLIIFLLMFLFINNSKKMTNKKIIDQNINGEEKNDEEIVEKATKIPIFTFHRIVSDKLKNERFKNNEWAASIDVFESQIKYMYDNGYGTISMDEFYCWYRKKCEFPKKTVMITFDDGNADDYYLVMPVLKKYNFKATTFIVGSRTLDIDENPYDENIRTFITKEIITKTKKIYPNLEYQSHTWDMHQVDSNKKERVLNLTEQQIKEDFDKQEQFHFKYLAYPYGIYNEKIIKQLKEHNYNLAFTFRTHDYATRESKQYEIPRIKINGFSDVEEIKKWLNY